MSEADGKPVAADLVELGVMTPEEAAVSNYRNVLRQALGAQEDVEVALCRSPLVATT